MKDCRSGLTGRFLLMLQLASISAAVQAQPLVMGIALHPYIVGQPYRLRHLRRALQHIQRERESAAGRVWLTNPGAVCAHVSAAAAAGAT